MEKVYVAVDFNNKFIGAYGDVEMASRLAIDNGGDVLQYEFDGTNWILIEVDDRSNECESVLVENCVDDLLFYYNTYPDEREEWAEMFKTAFSEIVDEIFYNGEEL